MLMDEPFNVVVAGVGGQGNVFMARALGELMLGQGFQVTIGETYGAAQRGGAVMSHLRLSRSGGPGPLVPEGMAHVVIALEPVEALRVLGSYGNPRVRVIANTRAVLPLEDREAYPALPRILQHVRDLSAQAWSVAATDIALRLGDPVLANMVMFGAMEPLDVLPIRRDAFEIVLARLLDRSQRDRAMQAYEAGLGQAVPIG